MTVGLFIVIIVTVLFLGAIMTAADNVDRTKGL